MRHLYVLTLWEMNASLANHGKLVLVKLVCVRCVNIYNIFILKIVLYTDNIYILT
jgi:hypothetical protein